MAIPAIALMAVGQASGQTVRPVAHIWLSPHRIHVGQRAIIAGRVLPNVSGNRVSLQQLTGGRWHTISAKRLNVHSGYRFHVHPRTHGIRTYRVSALAGPRGKYRVRSVSVRLHVHARQQSNCTPGYSPCIAPGPDVDCAGGSGNGPRYVQGPVEVTGSDPYGLDSDGDGVGCES